MSYNTADFDAVCAVLEAKGCGHCTASICEAFNGAGYPPAEWATTLHAMDPPTFHELIRAIESEMAAKPPAPAPAPSGPAPTAGWDLLDLGPLVPPPYEVTPPAQNSLLELSPFRSEPDLAALAAPPTGADSGGGGSSTSAVAAVSTATAAAGVGSGGPATISESWSEPGVDLLGLCLHAPSAPATALPLPMEATPAKHHHTGAVAILGHSSNGGSSGTVTTSSSSSGSSLAPPVASASSSGAGLLDLTAFGGGSSGASSEALPPPVLTLPGAAGGGTDSEAEVELGFSQHSSSMAAAALLPTALPTLRVRFHIIRNARIENVGKISVMHGF